MTGIKEDYYSGAMWLHFGLSYASYLVLPRVVLCSMPAEWQERMAALLDEMRQTIDYDGGNDYVVTARIAGRFTSDPLGAYKYPDLDLIRAKEP